jgi:hypothetical protein
MVWPAAPIHPGTIVVRTRGLGNTLHLSTILPREGTILTAGVILALNATATVQQNQIEHKKRYVEMQISANKSGRLFSHPLTLEGFTYYQRQTIRTVFRLSDNVEERFVCREPGRRW